MIADNARLTPPRCKKHTAYDDTSLMPHHHKKHTASFAHSTGKFPSKDNDHKDKDPFIGPQEFVVGYSMVSEQPQSSARHSCHSHAMTSTWHEQAPYALLHIGVHRTTHCTMGDDIGGYVAIKYINRCNAMT